MDALSVTQTLIDRARLFRQVTTVANILPNKNYFSDTILATFVALSKIWNPRMNMGQNVLICCSYFF